MSKKDKELSIWAYVGIAAASLMLFFSGVYVRGVWDDTKEPKASQAAVFQYKDVVEVDMTGTRYENFYDRCEGEITDVNNKGFYIVALECTRTHDQSSIGEPYQHTHTDYMKWATKDTSKLKLVK